MLSSCTGGLLLTERAMQKATHLSSLQLQAASSFDSISRMGSVPIKYQNVFDDRKLPV